MKKTLLFFALLGMIVFVSCDDKNGWDKDDFDKEKWDKEDWDDKDGAGCFDLVYPVSYSMPDGTTITENDKEGLWTAIKVWYNDHSDVEAKPELQYPVNVMFYDEKTKEISNEDEMTELKKDCEWGKDWECFDLVYPVTFTMPDDSTISGADKEELWTAIKTWYENRPDIEEKPTLQYPVSIMFKDDTTQSIANEEGMKTAKKSCED